MQTVRLSPVLLAHLLLFSFAAEAKDDLSLAELIKLRLEVSSAKPQTIFETPSSVSVIDRRTIETFHFQSISEALKTLAGIDVTRTFFAQNVPSIRGILQDNYVNRLLILIDGVPTWDSVTGHGELERISISQLERIEVLKGPASVLYGSNAYSGAINLIPRRGSDDDSHSEEHEFRAAAGALSGLLAAGGHALSVDPKQRIFVAASAETQNGSPYPGKNSRGERGFFRDEAGNSIYFKDFQNKSNFTAQMSVDTDHGKHSLLTNIFRNSLSYLGAKPLVSQGLGNPYQVSGKLLQYNFQYPLEHSAFKFSSLYDANSREFSRKEDNRVKGRIQGLRLLNRAQWNGDLNNYFDAELGLDIEDRSSQRFELFDPLDQKIFQDNEMSGRVNRERSLFAQLGFHGDKLPSEIPLSALLGIRQTKNDAYDQNTSLRSTLVYRLHPETSIKAVYGQAFRAPSLFELYYQDSAATNEIYGNPDLKPETSDSFELAFLSAPSQNLFYQLTYFQDRYKNKIVRTARNPESATDTSLIFANSASFQARGTELEVHWQDPQGLDVITTLSHSTGDSGDKINDRWNFKYIPAWNGHLALAKKIASWSYTASAHYRGKTEGPKAPIAATGRADLSASYQRDSSQHSILIKNLSNTEQKVPEYIRGELNSLSTGEAREVMYEYTTRF